MCGGVLCRTSPQQPQDDDDDDDDGDDDDDDDDVGGGGCGDDDDYVVVEVKMVNCECDDDHENTIRYRYINLKVFYLRQPFHARQLSYLHFLKHYKKHCKF